MASLCSQRENLSTLFLTWIIAICTLGQTMRSIVNNGQTLLIKFQNRTLWYLNHNFVGIERFLLKYIHGTRTVLQLLHNL